MTTACRRHGDAIMLLATSCDLCYSGVRHHYGVWKIRYDADIEARPCVSTEKASMADISLELKTIIIVRTSVYGRK